MKTCCPVACLDTPKFTLTHKTNTLGDDGLLQCRDPSCTTDWCPIWGSSITFISEMFGGRNCLQNNIIQLSCFEIGCQICRARDLEVLFTSILFGSECLLWSQAYRWRAWLCTRLPNTSISSSHWAAISHSRYWTQLEMQNFSGLGCNLTRFTFPFPSLAEDIY